MAKLYVSAISDLTVYVFVTGVYVTVKGVCGLETVVKPPDKLISVMVALSPLLVVLMVTLTVLLVPTSAVVPSYVIEVKVTPANTGGIRNKTVKTQIKILTNLIISIPL